MHLSEPRFVTSYVNPDTDGVCSSIGFAHWRQRVSGAVVEAVIFGEPDAETVYVLDYFSVNLPLCNINPQSSDLFAIVDTHHPNQLASVIPRNNVVTIIDHHPLGSPSAFPQATLQNESVGAAATLVAERFRADCFIPERPVAGCLAAAIVSNTLDFRAPSTTERDRRAYEWLTEIAPIARGFIDQMFHVRSQHLTTSTGDIIMSDYKEFPFDGYLVGISQLETMEPHSIIERDDLTSTLSQIKRERELAYMIVNIVDLRQEESTIIADGVDTAKLVEAALGQPCPRGQAKFNRILLRKTDLVPQFQRVLEQE